LPQSEVLLGIGSNLDNREENISKALIALERHLVIKRVSSLYETEPIGYVNQPDFLNLCIKVETEMNPFELLSFLKAVESELGRKESLRWGPRTIDIDILLFDVKLIYSRRLTVPHKELLRRKFAMEPACEIAGQWIYPGLHRTLKALYRERREALAIQKVIKIR